MAITRRTERFRELAEEIHRACARKGRIDVDPALIDKLLNLHIDEAAKALRVGPRSALAYAPDDLAEQLADLIVTPG